MMAKIIDVRFRPPLGSFLNMTMYTHKDRSARMTQAMGLELAPSMLQESMDMLLEEMDSIGEYQGCVSGMKRGVDPAWGWIENDEIYAIVNQYPDRLIGIGAIDATDTAQALEDVEKCIMAYGFKAIVMEPGNHQVGMYADDRRLFPIYAKCVELDIPVFLLAGGNAGPDCTYSHPVHVEHVAADMPALNLVVLHGAWPWVTQILHVAFRRPNIYLAADMYITMPGGEQYITAVNTYLSDRFLYSASYPFGPVVGYYDMFRGLGIKETYMDKVLYQNAHKLLKLA